MTAIFHKMKQVFTDPRFYGRRLLQEIELQTGVRCSKPSEIWLKITERCNCRCRMCTICERNQTRDGELSFEDWKWVLSGLRQWLGKKHIWFTGGEPFLRKDFLPLLRHANRLGLSTAVITNGILLNPRRIDELIDSGLNEYHVSIDSMKPEIHDHLRGISGAHKRASENVLLLKNKLQKNKHDMKIVIKTIIMGYNFPEIIPLLDWVKENSFDEIKFQPLESNLEGEDNPLWFRNSPYWYSKTQEKAFYEMLSNLLMKKEQGYPVYNSSEEITEIIEYFKDPVSAYDTAKAHTFGASQKPGCSNGLSWMEILSRGGLRMCRHMPPMGDIRNASSPKEFWKSRLKCWENKNCFACKQKLNL